MSRKEIFQQGAYNRLKAAIVAIDQAERPAIYALSCWYSLEEDDPRYPSLLLGYNTTQQVQAQLYYASDEAEAKWNYAFWLQNELVSMGGKADSQLAAWFQESPFYYSQAEHDANDEALFNKLIVISELFNNEFIEVGISLIQQLFRENIIAEIFGRNIPVLLHELEYYDEPVEWTRRANPPGIANEFCQAFGEGTL